jgi:hypothetical protein
MFFAAEGGKKAQQTSYLRSSMRWMACRLEHKCGNRDTRVARKQRAMFSDA